jgi:toxin ParE1/3/4
MNFEIIISPEAQADLDSITDYLFEVGGVSAEAKFINQFDKILKSFEVFPHQGDIHDEHFMGLRIVGIAKRATIAFVVEDYKVIILRIIYKGGDWKRELVE